MVGRDPTSRPKSKGSNVGLYNFNRRFMENIVSGKKRQTIRATRKHMDQPGDIMHLYTGLRTKGTILLGRVTCTSVDRVEIWKVWANGDSEAHVKVSGIELHGAVREAFAKADGFPNWAEMVTFWQIKNRLPFDGHVYRWNEVPKS